MESLSEVPRKLLEGTHVEVRQNDIGLRGSWRPASVVKVKFGRRVVEYDDVLCLHGSKKLQESVPLFEDLKFSHGSSYSETHGTNLSYPNKQRGWIRPLPPACDFPPQEWSRGLLVDAFYNDAWWEGILLDKGYEELKVNVFFPYEEDYLKIPLKDIRVSQEWDEVTGKWSVPIYWSLCETCNHSIDECKQMFPRWNCLKNKWTHKKTLSGLLEEPATSPSCNQLTSFKLDNVVREESVLERLEMPNLSVSSSLIPGGTGPMTSRKSWLTSMESLSGCKIIQKLAKEKYITLAGSFVSTVDDINAADTSIMDYTSKLCSERLNSYKYLRSSSLNQNGDLYDKNNKSVHTSDQFLPRIYQKTINSEQIVNPFSGEKGSVPTPWVGLQLAGNKDANIEAAILLPEGSRFSASTMFSFEEELVATMNVHESVTAFAERRLLPLVVSRSQDCLKVSGSELKESPINQFANQLPRERDIPISLDDSRPTEIPIVTVNSRSNSSWRCDENIWHRNQDSKFEHFGTILSECKKIRMNHDCSSAKKYLLDAGCCTQSSSTTFDAMYVSPSESRFFSLTAACGVVKNSKGVSASMETDIDRQTCLLNAYNMTKTVVMDIFSDRHVCDTFQHLHENTEISGYSNNTNEHNKEMFAKNGMQENIPEIRNQAFNFDRQTKRKNVTYDNNSMVEPKRRRGRPPLNKDNNSHGQMQVLFSIPEEMKDKGVQKGNRLQTSSKDILLGDRRPTSDCQVKAYAVQDAKQKDGRFKDASDDICGICGDGGELILCDRCPSTFHLNCVGLMLLPEGDWYCSRCTCDICGNSLPASDLKSNMLQCTQCELSYHITCTRINSIDVSNLANGDTWFCSKQCENIFINLRGLLGIINPLENGLSWMLLKSMDEEQTVETVSLQPVADHYDKLSVAHGVMQECFVPMIDPHTKTDLIYQALYNRRSHIARLNYCGFYAIVLEKGDEIISVATIRVHGAKLAELPLVGTKNKYRRQGMCRCLMIAIEEMLRALGVEKLILPAVSDLLDTWLDSFNFQNISRTESQEIKKFCLMMFPGTTLLQKLLNPLPSRAIHTNGRVKQLRRLKQSTFKSVNELLRAENREVPEQRSCKSVETFFAMARASLDKLDNGVVELSIPVMNNMAQDQNEKSFCNDNSLNSTATAVPAENKNECKTNFGCPYEAHVEHKDDMYSKVVLGRTRSKRLITSRRWVAEGLSELIDARRLHS